MRHERIDKIPGRRVCARPKIKADAINHRDVRRDQLANRRGIVASQHHYFQLRLRLPAVTPQKHVVGKVAVKILPAAVVGERTRNARRVSQFLGKQIVVRRIPPIMPAANAGRITIKTVRRKIKIRRPLRRLLRARLPADFFAAEIVVPGKIRPKEFVGPASFRFLAGHCLVGRVGFLRRRLPRQCVQHSRRQRGPV